PSSGAGVENDCIKSPYRQPRLRSQNKRTCIIASVGGNDPCRLKLFSVHHDRKGRWSLHHGTQDGQCVGEFSETPFQLLIEPGHDFSIKACARHQEECLTIRKGTCHFDHRPSHQHLCNIGRLFRHPDFIREHVPGACRDNTYRDGRPLAYSHCKSANSAIATSSDDGVEAFKLHVPGNGFWRCPCRDAPGSKHDDFSAATLEFRSDATGKSAAAHT